MESLPNRRGDSSRKQLVLSRKHSVPSSLERSSPSSDAFGPNMAAFGVCSLRNFGHKKKNPNFTPQSNFVTEFRLNRIWPRNWCFTSVKNHAGGGAEPHLSQRLNKRKQSVDNAFEPNQDIWPELVFLQKLVMCNVCCVVCGVFGRCLHAMFEWGIFPPDGPLPRTHFASPCTILCSLDLPKGFALFFSFSQAEILGRRGVSLWGVYSLPRFCDRVFAQRDPEQPP